MKRFYCHCGKEIFFDNLYCLHCQNQLGFDPEEQQLVALYAKGGAWRRFDNNVTTYRLCEHRTHRLQCNWLVPNQDNNPQCLSCRLTTQIPFQGIENNINRWQRLESAKRRMLYGVLSLGLSLTAFNSGANNLNFHFLEDQRSNPDVATEHVYSGHSNGVIIINASEADSDYREETREAMNESYRTLLGHFRHEIGHYFWQDILLDPQQKRNYAQLFGDPDKNYAVSLQYYYDEGPIPDWQTSYISAYASAHPLEDWAETWAHYLLIVDTIETGIEYGLLPLKMQYQFDELMSEWMQLVVVLNALNQSIGNPNAYPFVISSKVHDKLRFIHDYVRLRATHYSWVPGKSGIA